MTLRLAALFIFSILGVSFSLGASEKNEQVKKDSVDLGFGEGMSLTSSVSVVVSNLKEFFRRSRRILIGDTDGTKVEVPDKMEFEGEEFYDALEENSGITLGEFNAKIMFDKCKFDQKIRLDKNKELYKDTKYFRCKDDFYVEITEEEFTSVFNSCDFETKIDLKTLPHVSINDLCQIGFKMTEPSKIYGDRDVVYWIQMPGKPDKMATKQEYLYFKDHCLKALKQGLSSYTQFEVSAFTINNCNVEVKVISAEVARCEGILENSYAYIGPNGSEKITEKEFEFLKELCLTGKNIPRNLREISKAKATPKGQRIILRPSCEVEISQIKETEETYLAMMFPMRNPTTEMKMGEKEFILALKICQPFN